MGEQVFEDPLTGRLGTWRQFTSLVHRQVRYRCPRASDALVEDAVQYAVGDVALAAQRHAALRTESGRMHWWYCVRWARQRACQHVARHARKYSRELSTGERAGVENVAGAHVDMATRVTDPLELVASADILERVRKFRDQLPAELRAEVELLHGGSQRDLAERLGISKSAVAECQRKLALRLREEAWRRGLLDAEYGGSENK